MTQNRNSFSARPKKRNKHTISRTVRDIVTELEIRPGRALISPAKLNLLNVLNNSLVQALTCVGVTSPMSSESLLDVLWHGLVCSSWTISVTAAHTRQSPGQEKRFSVCNRCGISQTGLNTFTFQGIPGESELVYNVSGDVSLDAVAHLGLTFCNLQTLIKLLWIKLLREHFLKSRSFIHLTQVPM